MNVGLFACTNAFKGVNPETSHSKGQNIDFNKRNKLKSLRHGHTCYDIISWRAGWSWGAAPAVPPPPHTLQPPHPHPPPPAPPADDQWTTSAIIPQNDFPGLWFISAVHWVLITRPSKSTIKPHYASNEFHQKAEQEKVFLFFFFFLTFSF